MGIYTKTVKKEKNCAQCGNVFLAFAERCSCCSAKCRDKLRSDRLKIARAGLFSPPDRKACSHCEKEYQPTTGLSNFCSDRCMQRAKYEKNPYNRETFGTGTTANRGKKQSSEHVKKRAESLAKTLSLTVRNCVKCGDAYTPTLAAQKYCSGRCWTSVSRVKKDRMHVISVHPEHYKVLFDLQDGKCQICGSPGGSNGRGDKLAVDHCHTSGKIRGLLCHKCNTALGLLKDSQENLQAAIRYLAASC